MSDENNITTTELINRLDQILKVLKIYQDYTCELVRKVEYITGALYHQGILNAIDIGVLNATDLKDLSKMEEEHEEERNNLS